MTACWHAPLVAACLLALAPAGASEVVPLQVSGDAIGQPLHGLSGDAARGALVVRNRETGNCLICHAIPDRTERFQGEIGPPLAGVGLRLTEGQIRLRLVDPTQVNPGAIMPAYHRVSGLTNVDARHAGRPVLGAQEIEDVVAYLASLKE
ncbi:MAG: sulfur oxidation c-type cytochrome SoxX [Hyphomicrobiales bacterium]|nr:sulfur oxidation c-type cytochrome SoxX [Hyphomicrobiales bacterium]